MDNATITRLQAAWRDGSLGITAFAQQCLDRIAAYDRRGPALQSLITVNPRALEEAQRLEAEVRARPGAVGPLHGVPLILKDNFDTHDLPTTGGNVAMRHSQPRRDAFVVQRLRAAGALVLAKANLQEFARGGVSVSSLGGQVRNPYDLTRSAGGSSGGTAAAIAAEFAVLGTGSDTGQSIRSPASACCLVGLRPTRGLVSRAGIMPNSFTQDEAGPITRTVRDAALMLDAMAGFDPQDPVTALGVGRVPASYAHALRPDALRGARIGWLEDMFGREERHADVNRVMERAAHTMQAQGATVLRLSIPGLEELAAQVGTDSWEARAAFDAYFEALGPGQPVGSFRQLVASRTAVPEIQRTMEAEIAIEHGLDHPEYLRRLRNRDRLRILLASHMARHRLDALLYPLQRVLVVPLGQPEQPERNGMLSHGTGFPAIAFPAGFSTPTASAPLGVPVGAELLGTDFQEPRLLALAHAFEQAGAVRRPPLATPPLARAP